MKIRDIMKSPAIAVRPDETVKKALEIMKNEGINGTPIIDDENHVIGIIVKADIYRFLIDPGHYDTCPVEWVMTKEVVNVDADEDILEAAKKLRQKNIIAMPVLDDGVLVGTVSLEDFVDYFIKERSLRG